MSADDREYKIAVLPGDGIGIEVMEAGILVLKAEAELSGITFDLDYLDAGAGVYQHTGEALPNATLTAAERCDAILLGAMGLPGIRYPDGREIAPQLDLRTHFELYAGVRPIRSIPGLQGTLRNEKADQIDLVIVRESTEGLFAERNIGKVVANSVARDAMVITRAVSESLFRYTFELARNMTKADKTTRVTCVDKANVLTSMAFFREIFDETAKKYPDIVADHSYVDATALSLVRNPWDFDVLVTENMFGDILSDLAAGIIGGMGVAPSADIGIAAAVFQPSHGTAPDLIGTGRANPVAMILSVGMMLDWLGKSFNDPRCLTSANRIAMAVDQTFVSGEIRPAEWGGQSTTSEIAIAVIANLPTAAGLRT